MTENHVAYVSYKCSLELQHLSLAVSIRGAPLDVQQAECVASALAAPRRDVLPLVVELASCPFPAAFGTWCSVLGS